MSNDLNQWQGIGRLGKDPESRSTGSGDAVCSFSVACGWKSKDREGTEWVNVTAFGKLAEICGEYLTKGKQVFIQGRLTTDKYTDKQGVERYSTKVIADRMQMLGGKDGSQDKPQQHQERAPSRDASYGDRASGGFQDDEIPFDVFRRRSYF
jgi:single-strand DNA-binding protein